VHVFKKIVYNISIYYCFTDQVGKLIPRRYPILPCFCNLQYVSWLECLFGSMVCMNQDFGMILIFFGMHF
jgi:hypothetical protein